MKPLKGDLQLRFVSLSCSVALHALEPKSSPRRRRGLDASTDRGLPESSGEVFLLDILSHRMSDIESYANLGSRSGINTTLARYQFGFHRHVSGDNAAELAWRGPLRSGVCCHPKGRHRGTVPTCRRRSLSPQSLDADTSTTPRRSHRYANWQQRRGFECKRDLHEAAGAADAIACSGAAGCVG